MAAGTRRRLGGTPPVEAELRLLPRWTTTGHASLRPDRHLTTGFLLGGVEGSGDTADFRNWLRGEEQAPLERELRKVQQRVSARDKRDKRERAYERAACREETRHVVESAETGKEEAEGRSLGERLRFRRLRRQYGEEGAEKRVCWRNTAVSAAGQEAREERRSASRRAFATRRRFVPGPLFLEQRVCESTRRPDCKANLSLESVASSASLRPAARVL